MPKTERMVVLLEPDLLKTAKDFAKKRSKTLAAFVRMSLLKFIEDEAKKKRAKKLIAIGKYRMPLHDIESPKNLEHVLSTDYRHD